MNGVLRVVVQELRGTFFPERPEILGLDVDL